MVAKRERFSDVLRRGLRRPARHQPAAQAPVAMCVGCGHPCDAHPDGVSHRSACAVCIWEVDMGRRSQQMWCQLPIATCE